jgi:hypothetical protein
MKIARSPALVISGLAAAAALALAGCSSGAASTGAQQHPVPSGSVQWLTAPKTPTVAQVAAEMGANGVTDCHGGGEGVGAADTGTAYLGKKRLGINVFPTDALRNSWETGVAASAGVTVVAQGQDWVAYKALNQAGTGCN